MCSRSRASLACASRALSLSIFFLRCWRRFNSVLRSTMTENPSLGAENREQGGCRRPAPPCPPFCHRRRELARGNRLYFTVSGFIAGVALTAYLGHVLGARAQLAERPGNSLDNPVDVP